MFQKFHTDTLMSRFIKSMLNYHPLSLYDYVAEGDMIIEGFRYIYKNWVIRCVRTGLFFIGEEESTLFPSKNLYPSPKLLSKGGDVVALFNVTHYVHELSEKQSSYTYHSRTHWYDADTHRYLGEYLRMLRSTKNLNLLPFYNCYSTKQIVDVYLRSLPRNLYPSKELHPSNNIYPKHYDPSTKTYGFGNNDDFRIVAVPVKFNRKYTIAIECPSEFRLRCLIYNSSTGMVPVDQAGSYYYSDYSDLKDSFMLIPSSRFDTPFLYEVKTVSKDLYSRQKDLLLLIQVPKTCTSSVVILEGDYTDLDRFKTNQLGKRINPEFFNLSLLRYNTNEIVAFSDRLIEYLLLNVITHQDPYPGNVEKYQRLLSNKDSLYAKKVLSHNMSFGVWDNDIRNSVIRLMEVSSVEKCLYDHDGYINKDVEKLLYSMFGGN